jgi:hypothetical protein
MCARWERFRSDCGNTDYGPGTLNLTNPRVQRAEQSILLEYTVARRILD